MRVTSTVLDGWEEPAVFLALGWLMVWEWMNPGPARARRSRGSGDSRGKTSLASGSAPARAALDGRAGDARLDRRRS